MPPCPSAKTKVVHLVSAKQEANQITTGTCTEKTSCMKLVSCNEYDPNNLLLMSTQEKVHVLTAVKVAMLFLWL
jgi:hypothetical protein